MAVINNMKEQELRQLMALCVALVNEPKIETAKEILNILGELSLPIPVDRFLNLESGEYAHVAERIYCKSMMALVRNLDRQMIEDAWYFNHPKRELTDEDRVRIKNCESIIFNYEVIDNPMPSDEYLRVAADEARDRIREIEGRYPGNYKTGTRYYVGMTIEKKE